MRSRKKKKRKKKITYKTVDIHPVRVGLSTGCALYFKPIEVGGVGSVEWEEVGYAIWGVFFCVLEGGAWTGRGETSRIRQEGGREGLPCKICC